MPSVCWTSANKHVHYELHWLFELQPRFSHNCWNERHESLSQGKRKKEGWNLAYLPHYTNDNLMFLHFWSKMIKWTLLCKTMQALLIEKLPAMKSLFWVPGFEPTTFPARRDHLKNFRSILISFLLFHFSIDPSFYRTSDIDSFWIVVPVWPNY